MGKAGAAARKSKKEALECELRKYKASLYAALDGEGHAAVSSVCKTPWGAPPNPAFMIPESGHLAEPPVVKPKHQRKVEYTWLPLAIAGVSLVAVFYGRTLYESFIGRRLADVLETAPRPEDKANTVSQVQGAQPQVEHLESTRGGFIVI